MDSLIDDFHFVYSVTKEHIRDIYIDTHECTKLRA